MVDEKTERIGTSMRHAYLIIAHDRPEELQRLIRALDCFKIVIFYFFKIFIILQICVFQIGIIKKY